ncbi:hypothetical protein PR202_gb07716 [Eleusine coracana subsp. coracana]|uniref:Aldose 1-epimerase n=1 Tax=Eleusine coracana subsp. coracana TaxID=191504 RepID=A0AAV5ECV5_ELECO|nr:hypothetical protein PR202_gb07716 [Eleusine coracana subsp. coracana]
MAAEPKILELSNGRITARIANWGATITSLLVPDAHGLHRISRASLYVLTTYVQDYEYVKRIEGMAPYFGCIVGRVANRINNGKFTLNGVEYSLPINNGPNSLHGGLKGFDKVVWDVVEQKDGQCSSITFQYHSKDGEEGYPGDVTVRATYSLPEDTTLRLDMEATPDNKATPISLAQHTYWNLAGHDSGEIMPVEGTPFDFTTEHKIGEHINDVPGGYDHNYVLDSGDEKNGLMKHAAKLRDPSGSRTLDLWTDAPGMQFYTANYVDGITGKGGAVYEKHAGACLETQGFPDAINRPSFPSVVVKPGDKYKHTMLFVFSA